ncbi:nuclear transport factor 2 family protein [filamentous cyanobacterium LEGE 11480]|uniref:Nuclear transport factor 2 family protein n=1 Tax=Romeriopsis navalis LEGE 11480 TaxID=2777977 RepID=A0A928VJN8_9CYAN|nr:hypothetical protein [Romeriopsis navalis]MBE9029863.1 nuclear transport factor 2 family protein [Romeriopsis navalis LEGE 11480]
MPSLFSLFHRPATVMTTIAALSAIALPASATSLVQLTNATIISAPAPTDALNQTVQALHNQMDQAANQRNRQGLLRFYSLEFTNSDGLNRETLSQSLRQIWQQYPQLTYRTQVLKAKRVGSGIDAETMTTVSGKQVRGGREVMVNITARSIQRWEKQQLVQQEILSEQTKLSFGENPPTVSVNLPDKIQVGQKYNYEAIVQEPLGKDILMGQLFDRAITTSAVTRPKTLQLDMPSILELIGNRSFPRPRRQLKPNAQRITLKRLRAGGFFKSGFAPRTPENRRISAILVRHDAGVTIVTRRLRVVEK